MGIKSGQYSAFFYTLISENTRESDMAIARQKFLMDQGYTYELLPFKNLKGIQPETQEWEHQLLENILNLSDSDLKNQDDRDRDGGQGAQIKKRGRRRENQFYAETERL